MIASLRSLWHRAPRKLRYGAIALAAPLLLFLLLDLLLPLPYAQLERPFSALVVAEDGTPLRAFADGEGVWRYAVTPEEVSPRYIEALLGYEDRWFYSHPGVNPFALLRGGWHWLYHGRIVSGGSTLTMQVARIVDPGERSIGGKLWQIFRALQLELHYSKREILTFYLNRAPFGGPLEGVEAASFAYLGKSARQLSHAEAALLAVLPQSPSRLRPDRHPQRAEQARNKVLQRMAALGVWPPREVEEARIEHVEQRFNSQPMVAPLLAERFRDAALQHGRLVTTLDARLQAMVENRLRDRAASLPERSSAAILVVENSNLYVRAYAGSVDLFNEERFGHVDMVRATRSPGSTLKPFLYGLALDDGMIHSESLLVDVPYAFNGYQPGNFLGGFSGPVSVSEALQRSLNVPAVDLLERIGPERFVAALRNGGLRLLLPDGGKPNLSIILGGAGASLEALVSAYTALGRGGMSGELRYQPTTAPISEHHMMSAGAAWIIGDILGANGRPGLGIDSELLTTPRRVAWKTGTSYGFRDAWAVGVTERYTIGVWVGRPDATPLPGHFGAATAAPLLFDVVDMVRGDAQQSLARARPASVTEREICWPLGTPPEAGREALCHQRRSAWLLNETTPPTLPDRVQQGNLRVSYWVNARNGRRVDNNCTAKERVPRELARWPALLESWLSGELRARERLPRPDRSCPGLLASGSSGVHILGLKEGTVLHRAGANGGKPQITLSSAGGDGPLYWLINGKWVAESHRGGVINHQFDGVGLYAITLMDQAGNFDRIAVKVID